MGRAYYSSTISRFCEESPLQILGAITAANQFALLGTQRDAWVEQIELLQPILKPFEGSIYLEYSIPRMGKRVDVLLIINGVIFVVEFKVGAPKFLGGDIDQVVDYALDLRNFHEGSHDAYIVPVLVATETESAYRTSVLPSKDKLFSPIFCNGLGLAEIIHDVLSEASAGSIDVVSWEASGYKPTPTIIEATLALYNGHSVVDISRNDAGAVNLTKTSSCVKEIIQRSRANSEKAVVFVTGVPGAGKTLVGLDVATTHISPEDDLYSVFLSGNGPLVSILQEALARDKVARKKEQGEFFRKGEARSEVKAFIQNVHHFRDDGLADLEKAPIEHVALFDEAQRAWDKEQTSSFMKAKKGLPDFSLSEPEFLISCMDRHDDWAVVVCLVGGGQEINKGEAGIFGWAQAVKESFPAWKIYASDQLLDSEYGGEPTIQGLRSIEDSTFIPQLHLKSSMRSFRSENVSLFVKQLLDLESSQAKKTFSEVSKDYPIVLTRDLNQGREWLREQARGSERYGIVVSSQAERLRPLGINVKAPVNPVNWFLDGKDHVRSSYYLEDVATEFHVQGLELDWTCLIWDADFRYTPESWSNWSFRGNKWQRINKEERKTYQKNAYRVLLTRARQGMIIVVPEGSEDDLTRPKSFYDDTYEYLADIGLPVV
jgi:Schlafen group 3, DNA/RNA helicase domain